ncbi:acetyl-CoA acetyltransferase [Comamonas serinivorans]|uniref:Acetyl-CoA acetyltransferase n=1 Tax=Comamonas serinivorans TaxID=1082851 RepID=A0A1Y0ELA8_9BURK|nr:acetyl-CoA C-acetyltransferase [Comamonas serinivorans]ARU04424.1 acetyl-CoA acetyltransferase [Comamonas serinivorans]
MAAEAYIVAATRTAGGRRNGRVSGWHPADMSGLVINELLKRVDADPALIEDVIWGCVGQAGQQAVNIARNSVLSSNLPLTVPGTSIDRQCGSSQQALHFAAQAVMSGTMDIVIAGGVESMSRVPMGLASILPAKEGLGTYTSEAMGERFGNVKFSQFTGAEMIAKKHGFSKDEMDAFALISHKRAKAATESGKFTKEILPIDVRMADGTRTGEQHTVDEGIRMDATIESIAGVKLISEDGRLTAATSSQICDGASGVMVVNEQGLKTLGVKPLARIHHMSVLGDDPVIMLEAPIPATQRALKKAGLSLNDIDLYEVNEAFASVPMAWAKVLGADPQRLNVNGGAIALGHPLGGSGTKLMTTLVHALHEYGKRYGLQTMCEGGGMANVTIVERL